MKYILKKEYPGSPKLGYIDDLNKSGYNNQGEYVQSMYDKNPEFWEQVVEYPIGTKVHNSQTNTIYTKKKDGWYKPAEKTIYTDEMITKSNYINIIEDKVVEKDYLITGHYQKPDNIHINITGNFSKSFETEYLIYQVKRLSDGEIFTIGDKVFNEYLNYTINKIGIVNDKCMVSALYDTNNPNNSTLHYNLNNLKKAKQKLFTSEDGVDIFEGDKLYTIDKNNLQLYSNGTTAGHSSTKNPMYLYFSTKEKAEEYILMNKPCLSINDILSIKLCKDRREYRLKDLVKSKIQQSV